MKDKAAESQGLPSTEETKLGSILDDLTEEVQDVKDSILHISQKYRQDLTNQLEHSYKFEQHIARNFQRLNKKSKRVYQKSESLNTSLNKTLDHLKSYDELNGLSTDITDSVFGILESLTKIEMLLPYNERLSVRDSPHRAHYPNLYKLLNPKEEEDDTIRDQDELSSFEQLEIQGEEEYNEADESSNGEAGPDEVEEEDEDDGVELQSVVPSEDVRSDTIKPEVETEEPNSKKQSEYEPESKGELIDHDLPENKTDNGKNANLREESPEIKKVSEDTKNEELGLADLQKKQELELETVIDNYKTNKESKQQKSQSLKSPHPVRSSISIPTPSSAGVNATTGLSTNHEFPQSINKSIPTQAQGTMVYDSSSQGSSLADNLKKFISQNKSFSGDNVSP